MRAIPQAIERSLATPMMRPRLPAISGPAWAMSLLVMTSFLSRSQRANLPGDKPPTCPLKTPVIPAIAAIGSCVVTPENEGGIGATKAETVRHHTVKIDVILAPTRDRHIGEGGVQFIDVGAFADEAIVHHQQSVNRLLHPRGAQRVTCQRFGGGNRRQILAKNLANGIDLADVSDRRGGAVRIDIVDLADTLAVDALHGHAHAAHGTFAGRCHHVEAIGVGAVADELGIDPGAARLGALQLFQDDDPGTARNHKAVAVLVVGAARPTW